MIDVEGYTADEPVEDDYWDDEIGWEVNRYWQATRDHNRDGFLCYEAGSEPCLALGHAPNPAPAYESDEWGGEHCYGWDGMWICPETKYATACSECESEDCDRPTTIEPAEFWATIGRGAARVGADG